MTEQIVIPSDLLPADGRFGSGPSKVRPEAFAALADVSTSYLGTSHRKPTVMDVIDTLRQELAAFFQLPDGYEVVLANGGTTFFWDVAVHSLIEEQSEHLVFGEFSTRFCEFVERAPHLKDPVILRSETGTHPSVEVRSGVDTYALIHNETSTGVCMPVERPAGADAGSLVLVDATSGAAGLPVNPSEFDVYYFAPQKSFGADGGTWFALASPAAIERAERLQKSGRYIPTMLDFAEHLANSRKNSTYNTPALATLFLTLQQVQWFNKHGGLEWSVGRSAQLSQTVYDWAEAREFTSPYVVNTAERSPVTCTIDFDGVDAPTIAKQLRANGIVDTDGYRKLGRNQLRIATFPHIELADIEALLTCIDFVVERLG